VSEPHVIAGTAASFPVERLAVPCPGCGAPEVQLFYGVEGVPVHSCLLMATREQALGYPRGRLRLAACARCGFVTNTAFDPADNAYSAEYEETQGFSPTFGAFAESLVDRLVEEHDLAGRTVLEIGCGKGEFLLLLCARGGCRGIGIDPAFRPDRVPAELSGRVEFIQDLYDERHADLDADLIVCRHTLEHIAPTRAFMQTLRRTIGDRPTTLFFEVPDVRRVLDEGAFWDLYYEHCSYFSAGSLARLFRSTGFELSALELAYTDQYVIASARPAAGPTSPRFDLEHDLPDLRRGVDDFGDRCRRTLSSWRDFVEQRVARGRRVVLWGSGSKAVAFLTTVRPGDGIEHVVDINPHRHGHFMPGTGQRIVSPETLPTLRPDDVIVMNPVYAPEIREQLERLGVSAEVVAL
jgi:SAM-dependent methyltransferase